MLPGARTPSFGPGLSLLRRRMSAVFHDVKYGDETITAVQDVVNAAKARARSLPQPPQLCFYHPRFGRHSSAGAPAAGQRPRETPGAGIEELPFLP